MIRTLVVLTFLVQSLQGLLASPPPSTSGPPLDVLQVSLQVSAGTAGTQDRVCVLVAVDPAPGTALPGSALTVTAAGRRLPGELHAVLSGPVAFVIDGSAAGAKALLDGGSSGAAEFLLQVPPDAATSLIADRRPPAALTPLSVGISAELRTLSTLRPGGDRDTAAALDLALRELSGRSPTTSLVVLSTAAPDAGGETNAALRARLDQAHALLAVVMTTPHAQYTPHAPHAQYWSRVATATGGVAIESEPSRAIGAFDRLAGTLRTRYTISFPRPAGAASAELQIVDGDRSSTVTVALPRANRTNGSTNASSIERRNRIAGRLAIAVGLLMCGLAATAILLRRRHSPAAAHDHGTAHDHCARRPRRPRHKSGTPPPS